MNILALEASTSSAKAVIYSKDQGVIASLNKDFEKNISDIKSQDPEGIYMALLDCGKTLLGSSGDKVQGKIDIIALGSTWHSLLLTDKKGSPMGRALTWADVSAAETVMKYKKQGDLTNNIYGRTGCPTHANFPLWKWTFLKEEGGLSPDSILISSLPEYLFERMTGQRRVSLGAASGSGFLNIHTLEWDEEILAFADLKKDQLAYLEEPEYTGKIKSSQANILGLKDGIPVVICGPDGGLNQIGAGAMKDGIMTMSLGTSGAIRMAKDHPILPKSPSTWCYYVGEGKRLAGAAISGAGNCVNWFVKGLNRGIYSYEELESFIDKDRLFDAPTFLPFMFGERSPGWHSKRLGGFHGLRGDHSLGQLYYAILEGILLNLYQCYEILTRVGGAPTDIRISGGIENSEFWLQMAADIFKREIRTFDLEHGSVMGAIAIALKVLGGIDSLKDFEVTAKKAISPREDMAGFYEERFKKYKTWYDVEGCLL